MLDPTTGNPTFCDSFCKLPGDARRLRELGDKRERRNPKVPSALVPDDDGR